jgi:hypothetical protein
MATRLLRAVLTTSVVVGLVLGPLMVESTAAGQCAVHDACHAQDATDAAPDTASTACANCLAALHGHPHPHGLLAASHSLAPAPPACLPYAEPRSTTTPRLMASDIDHPPRARA